MTSGMSRSSLRRIWYPVTAPRTQPVNRALPLTLTFESALAIGLLSESVPFSSSPSTQVAVAQIFSIAS
jgi:hypothetical protein